jgi:threonine dehydratase
MGPLVIELKDLQEAQARIKAQVHRTPLRLSTTFSRMTGAKVYLKLENTQRTGSFKIRGALNKILTMPQEDRARGVIAASAGNHAQGVALAASLQGVKATIVMPEHAPLAKVMATRAYGAEVVLHGATYNDAYQKCVELQASRKLTLVHAFNDSVIMAGQGTLGLEIMEDLPDVDVVIVPVGGGGLISGVATAVKALRPKTRVVAVQPEGSASLPQSLKAGKVVPSERVYTIADGLATKYVGEETFKVIQKRVDECVTVTDHEIARALLLMLERSKNLVEGAGATALAALLSGKVDVKGKTVAVVISGGNIDINFLDQIIRRGLREEGRLIRFSSIIPDRPGQLRGLLDIIAQQQANVRDVWHERNRERLDFFQTEVLIEAETRGPEHRDQLLDALRKAGYKVELQV